MAKTKKRILSLAMALVMVFTLLPTTAFADESGELTAEELYAISGDMEEMNMTTMFDLASAALGLDGEYPKSLTFTGDGIDETIKMEEAAACKAVVSITAEAVYYDGRQVRVFYNGTASNLDPLNIHTEKVATYTFYDLDGNPISEAEQILKAGETIEYPVVSDKDHKHVTGWKLQDDTPYAASTAQLQKDGEGNPVDTEYALYPAYEFVWYVTFSDGSRVLETAAVVRNAEDKGTLTQDQIAAASALYEPGSGKVLGGWETAQNQPVFAGMEVSDDITLTPVVKDGIWVTFDSMGGSYVDSAMVENGKVSAPDAPTKDGYTFAGWYAQDAETEFVFTNTEITKNLTLYARWTANQVNYTVQFWLENANDKEYTYYDHASRQADSGTMVQATDSDKNGLTVTENGEQIKYTYAKSDMVEVAGDGSSILNIYYNRPTYTLTFSTEESNKPTCGKAEHTHSGRCYDWKLVCERGHIHTFGCYEWTLVCNKEEHQHDASCYQGGVIFTGQFKYDQDLSAVWAQEAIKKWTDAGNVWESSITKNKYYSYLEKMPNADLTMTQHKYGGFIYYYIYYYLQKLDGDYELFMTSKLKGKSGISLTYDEDYFPIAGYTQRVAKDQTKEGWENNKKGFAWDWQKECYEASLYYDRASFNLTFNNNFGGSETVSVPYQTELNTYYESNGYKPTRPGYSFAGWYEDPECTKPVSSTDTMPASSKVVYAKWTVNGSTVTVYPSPTATSYGTVPVENGGKVTQQQLLDALGITDTINLLGWYTKDDQGNWKAFNLNNVVSKDITLYARWKTDAYAVTYVAGDGSGTVTDNNRYAANAKAIVKPGSGLMPPNGKVFSHWEDASGKRYDPNTPVVVPQGGIKLTAKYVDKIDVSTVTVTYNANGGTGADVTTEAFANSQFTVEEYPDSFKPPEGKEFDSWNTDAEGHGTTYAPGALARADKSGDNILYAQYKDKTVTVTYDANGGNTASLPTRNPETVTWNGNITLTVTPPTHENKTIDGKSVQVLFVGWSDTQIPKILDKNDSVDTDGFITLAGDSTPKGKIVTEFKNVTTNKTVYAVWGYNTNGNSTADVLETKYTIRYQKNHDKATGTEPADSETYIDGDVVTLKGTGNLSCENHRLAGWALKSDATRALTGYTVAATDADATTNAINLYGVWTPEYYIVTVTYKLVNENGEISDYTGTVDAGKSFQVAMGQSWTILVGATSTENYVAPEQLTTGTGSNAVKYVYDSAKTTDNLTNSTATAVTLYYSKDQWDAGSNSETGGDNTPDYQQAVVKFVAGANGTVGVENTTQVFTLDKQTDGAYSKAVTPNNVTANADDGYAFDIWTTDTGTTAVNPFVEQTLTGGQTVTYKAHFETDVLDKNNPTVPGSDGIPDKYQAVVNFKAGSNGTLKGNTTHVITLKDANGNYAENQTVEVTGPTASANSRYDFDGWTGDAKCNSSAFKAEMKLEGGKSYTVTANFSRRSSGGGSHSGGTTIKDPEVPLGGLQLNKDDHFAYIKGYADGTVRPNNFITRAQVATIFYRLMTKETRTMYFSESNDFSDVSDDYWANKAISTLSNAGIITGFSDGTFRPNAFITRAQFAAIAARFSVVTEDLPNPFSDVPEGYWAEDLIAFAADVGWVNGYADGTFRPTANITRAAAMKLINNVLERQVDEDGLLKNATQWNDCTPDDWCYYIVMEATNSHDWERRSKKSLVEDWTALTADPVWDE